MPKHLDPHTPGSQAHPEDPCAVFEKRLDAFLDQTLDGAELDAFEAHAARCATCAEELEHARHVVEELCRLPAMSCPPAVSRAVLAHAEAHPGWRVRLRRALGLETPLWRPAFALLLVAALSVGVYRLSLPPDPAAGVTPQEIARAEAELKLAFAYLGEISREAGTTFGHEVGNRVVVPVGQNLAGAMLPEAKKAAGDEIRDGNRDRKGNNNAGIHNPGNGGDHAAS